MERNWESFDIKKQIGVKKDHNKQYKKKIETQRLLMRFFEIRFLFNGLFHYFGQLQAIDFIREGPSCKNRKLVVRARVNRVI